MKTGQHTQRVERCNVDALEVYIDARCFVQRRQVDIAEDCVNTEKQDKVTTSMHLIYESTHLIYESTQLIYESMHQVTTLTQLRNILHQLSFALIDQATFQHVIYKKEHVTNSDKGRAKYDDSYGGKKYHVNK